MFPLCSSSDPLQPSKVFLPSNLPALITLRRTVCVSSPDIDQSSYPDASTSASHHPHPYRRTRVSTYYSGTSHAVGWWVFVPKWTCASRSIGGLIIFRIPARDAYCYQNQIKTAQTLWYWQINISSDSGVWPRLGCWTMHEFTLWRERQKTQISRSYSMRYIRWINPQLNSPAEDFLLLNMLISKFDVANTGNWDFSSRLSNFLEVGLVEDHTLPGLAG